VVVPPAHTILASHRDSFSLSRRRRVTLLLAGTFLMGLADLYMTLVFVRSVGMMELNPIARSVMATNSPAVLAVWKISLTLLGVGILFYLRGFRRTEIAAWGVFIAMGVLMCHWYSFARYAGSSPAEFLALAQSEDPRWVTMPGE
jgi:hypothetical protein